LCIPRSSHEMQCNGCDTTISFVLLLSLHWCAAEIFHVDPCVMFLDPFWSHVVTAKAQTILGHCIVYAHYLGTNFKNNPFWIKKYTLIQKFCRNILLLPQLGIQIKERNNIWPPNEPWFSYLCWFCKYVWEQAMGRGCASFLGSIAGRQTPCCPYPLNGRRFNR
jgi:hypothetical protein